MENQIMLADSIRTIQQTIEIAVPVQDTFNLDTLCKIATVCIAAVNICLVLYIFSRNNTKDKNNNEKNRKINLLKTLVLDYNMKYLYDFFENLKNEANRLRENSLSNDGKKDINESILSLGNELRQKFIDPFLAIDSQLYHSLIQSIDKLLDSYTNTIFDDGINLSHPPKFEELVMKPMTATKTHIIKLLFSYSGE